MNSALKFRLRPLAVAIASCTTITGCAVWPGSGLPTATNLAARASTVTSPDPCARGLPDALRCARYLSNELAKLESDTGSWDTAYSLTSVAAGTLAAIYLKSSNDRSQAVEDLAVAVGALSGVRSVLRPDDRRKVAREGRLAVDCLIGAAEGITAAAADATSSKAMEQKAAADAKTAEQARTTLQAEQAQRQAIPRLAGNAAARSATQQKIDTAENRIKQATATVRTAEAQAEASATPYQKFERALVREYGLDTPSPAARGVVRSMTPAELRLRDAAVVRRQQMRVSKEAAAEADAAAVAAATLLPKQLAYSVYEILNHVRGSIADLSSASADIAKTQRTSVESLIADLKSKDEAEEKATEKFTGGEAVAPVGEPAGKEGANDISDKPKSAAKRQVAAIYQKCVVSE